MLQGIDPQFQLPIDLAQRLSDLVLFRVKILLPWHGSVLSTGPNGFDHVLHLAPGSIRDGGLRCQQVIQQQTLLTQLPQQTRCRLLQKIQAPLMFFNG